MKKTMNTNLTNRVYNRQRNASTSSFQRHSYASEDLVKRLGLETELQGHTGCVNCLQWNEDGTILASGSDDQHVVLWDPFKRRKLHAFHTGHRNNIFSVQFVPESGDRLLLSCAGDNTARLHDVNRTDDQRCVQVYACHAARVKRLAVTAAAPHLFWSAGEDGLVLQMDIREPPTCTAECNHVLINLIYHCGPDAEVKSIAINPTRPELIAVGSNDPFVRVFDRRMLRTCRVAIGQTASLTSDDAAGSAPETSAQYYVSGHLPIIHGDYRRRLRQLAVTNLTFSPAGDELLVNLGGEQIYLFDVVTNQRKASLLTDLSGLLDRALIRANEKPSTSTSNGYHHNGTSNGHTNGVSNGASNGASNGFLLTQSKPPGAMKPRVEALKQHANRLFEQERYSAAIALYSRALLLAPESAVLYANRAAALMRRGWDGDTYAALRDCYATLQRDPAHVKALFRLARCLLDNKMYTEARQCLRLFKAKYPEQAGSSAFDALEKDVRRIASESTGRTVNDRDALYSSRRPRGTRAVSVSAPSESGAESCDSAPEGVSMLDYRLRQYAADYKRRYCGHCNTTTDIKEANFFGGNGEFIIAGSDDGTFLIWDRATCNIVSVLRGDESIVNCLQPHPSLCVLATSGIEQVVRLWSPRSEEDYENERAVADVDAVATANQRRMNSDPLEVMLSNIGYHFEPNPSADSPGEGASVQCRQS